MNIDIKNEAEIRKIVNRYSNDVEVISNKFKAETIPFYHYTRRLENEEFDIIGRNLHSLLTEESDLLYFLNKREVSFKKVEDRIEVFYKNTKVEFECRDNYTPNQNIACLTLRKRLGYVEEEYIDYCFNGFLFDDLEKTSYIHLKQAPEFIRSLTIFLNEPNIQVDFYNESNFYCIEYEVSLNEIIFDKESNLNTKEEKNKYLWEKLIYKINGSDTNPILRLPDNEIMSEDYFIAKKIYTK